MPTEQEKRWIAAWRFAGSELERFRNDELRNLDDESTMRQLGAGKPLRQELNGLANPLVELKEESEILDHLKQLLGVSP